MHESRMEEMRREWGERIEWYEEQFEILESGGGAGDGGVGGIAEDRGGRGGTSDTRCDLLQKRLDATLDQVGELTKLLKDAEERAAAAEMRASDAESKAAAATLSSDGKANTTSEGEQVNDENCNKEVLRAQRIKMAETERTNREIKRQNDELKKRLQDMVQHKERAASSQRRLQQLESELQTVTRQIEEGDEARRRWMVFRNEIVEEGLIEEGDEVVAGVVGSSIPPEIATVVRKFQSLKRNLKDMHEENSRVTQVSEAYLRRCTALETQNNEKTQSIASLEKDINSKEELIGQLELENRKLIAQQQIWQRESEGMRSLLDTYEQQETVLAKSSKTSRSTVKLGVPSKTDESSPSVQGLQLSLKSAREEVKLLSETNKRLETDLEALRTEHSASKTEHERVLDKFGKLRNALMEERSKAEASEARACRAETLAGKGSYNEDTTRVVHLKSNPLSEAVREKYKTEIDSLKQRLEEAEETICSSAPMAGASTPAPSRVTGSFGSAGGSSSGKKGEEALSLDAKKLHKRLKEQFKEQIALFREGVHLVTGYKIDMLNSDTDPLFKVRSIYGEREEDHLMFRWPRKTVGPTAPLDMMNSEMAQLLMQGQSEVYISKCNSIPAFMAAVTLDLFDKQTVL